MKSKLFTILFLLVGQLNAQQLNQQFSDLMDNTETFKDYKVIKIEELNKFWEIVRDTTTLNKAKIDELRTLNESLLSNAENDQQTIESKHQEIEILKSQISNINVFGISVEKTFFKIVVFSTIGALILILAFSFVKLKERMSIANTRIQDYDLLEREYEAFKKEALEKQMKLRRELQTERNRQDEKRSTV